MWHRFRPELAIKYGLTEAVILGYIEFWIKQNEAHGRKENFKNGRWWMFNPVAKFSEDMPYLTSNQVRRALERLEREGAILVEKNFNKLGRDRTRWFTLGDGISHLANLPNGDNSQVAKMPNGEVPIWQNCQMHLANLPIPFGKSANCSTNKEPNIEPNMELKAACAREVPPGLGDVIAEFEKRFAFMNGQVAERLEALLADVGLAPIMTAMTKAKRAGASRWGAVSYVETAAEGIAHGDDYDIRFQRKGKNDVAGAVADVEQRLASEGGSENGDNSNSGAGDSVWGFWEG